MAKMCVVVNGDCVDLEYDAKTGTAKCPTCDTVFSVRKDASPHHRFAEAKNSVVILDGDHGADSASTSQGRERARAGVLAV